MTELLARAALCLWAALTGAYAAFCLVPFAWTHFVKEGLFPGPVAFALRWHAGLTVLAFVAAAAPLKTGKRSSWLAFAAVFAVLFLLKPLSGLEPGAYAAAVAAGAALPVLIWEALLAGPRLISLRPAPAGGQLVRMGSTLLAGAFCGFAAWAGASASGAAALGICVLAHAALFGAAFCVLEALPRALEPLLAWTAVYLLLRSLLSPLDLPPMALAAWAAGAAAAWGGLGLARGGLYRISLQPPPGPRRIACWALAAFLLVAPRSLLAGQDWNGIFASLAAAFAWALAFSLSARPGAGQDQAKPAWALVIGSCLVLLAGRAVFSWADPMLRPLGLSPAAAASRAAALSPSAALAMRALSPTESGGFYERLAAATNIPRGEPVNPARIDLVDRIVPVKDPPHVFLFVVDSLRRDYVGAGFTPNIDALAKEGVAFKAFTAYGGTGLSEPSIWAGSLLIHKQYVLPFRPMNALGRLFAELGYERIVTRDVVLSQLLEGEAVVPLDAEQSGNYMLCRTLQALEDRLDAVSKGRPIFVYTQPQDLHVSVVDRESRSNVTGKDYGRFEAAYASRLERLDGCLGGFVAALKRRDLYEDSIIIVTSDHGDFLGEDGRWGHAYSLAPEILRVPLVMRLPNRMRETATIDRDGPAFLTDIAPTLYQLLGQGPPRRDELLGRSLAALGSDPKAWRKPEQIAAASYGPVYAVIRDGRAVVADGIEFKLQAYDLENGRISTLSEEEAERAQDEILRHLERLDSFWGRK